MKLSVIVLAAGQGTRMRSRRPKVLQALAGRPLLSHVLDTARALTPEQLYVVVGHGGGEVREALSDAADEVLWITQEQQLGTGHAVMQALPRVPADHRVLVLCGDVPLVRASTLKRLTEAADDGLALLTVRLDDPGGYGRILRDAGGRVAAIREERDATAEERQLDEVNTGLLAAPAGGLARWLSRVGRDNAQGEYYLTDIVDMAVSEKVSVTAVTVADADEVLGINDRFQLAAAEAAHRRRNARALLEAGVTLVDPQRLDVRGRVHCGHDVYLDVNVVLEGEVRLGNGVHVEPNVILRNAVLEDGVRVGANSVIEGAVCGADAQVGPFARLRPGARLESAAKVGNFVEVKNSVLGRGSKANHLSYIGDAEVGEAVNVGAGTVTCNYDGADKHRTLIGDEAFIGSGAMLVAPVKIGAGATIGAGSTVTRDAPPGKLTVARARQSTVDGWRRPRKQSK